MKSNRPHFHVWIQARTGTMFYRLARGFDHAQTAKRWAKRNYPGQPSLVLQCHKRRCAPPLD